MTELSRFPDIEAMAARALRNASVCGGRAYSSIPRNPTWPLAVVQRLGGTPVDFRRLDQASIQVDVYGNDKSEARSEADSARVALHAAEGSSFYTEMGYLTGVEDQSGLTFLPDPVTNRDRYTFSVYLYAHTLYTT